MKKISKSKNPRINGEYAKIWQSVGKCVFCDLKEDFIIYEENDICLVQNKYPYSDGHLMAIPRAHISSPKELSAKQWNTIRKFNYLTKKLLKKVFDVKGMWTLIREGGEVAQMTVVDHLHVQFIPFSDPKLCTWKYSELKYTPKESIKKYKSEKKEILSLLKKFKEKYDN